MKIRLVEFELFHDDRRTGTTKLIVFFAILLTRLKRTHNRFFSSKLFSSKFYLKERLWFNQIFELDDDLLKVKICCIKWSTRIFSCVNFVYIIIIIVVIIFFFHIFWRWCQYTLARLYIRLYTLLGFMSVRALNNRYRRHGET